MNVLVTAGNTQAPVDRVRCITNVFTGRTGAAIAAEGANRGHAVTLLTSHPGALADLPQPLTGQPVSVLRFRTYDDLAGLLAEHVAGGRYDAVVHAAAVSDYLVAGVFAGSPGAGELADVSAGKVKSSHGELWLRLVPAPKLVDRVRPVWGFRGVLVKFKLEVGPTDAELLEIAERSRQQSSADLMVANTLEGSAHWAYVGSGTDYRKVSRAGLPAAVLDAVEATAGLIRFPGKNCRGERPA